MGRGDKIRTSVKKETIIKAFVDKYISPMWANRFTFDQTESNFSGNYSYSAVNETGTKYIIYINEKDRAVGYKSSSGLHSYVSINTLI